MVKDTPDTLGGMYRITTGDNEQFIFCTNEHDRKLIAAAPELLEACKSLLANLHDAEQDCYPEESENAGKEYPDVKRLKSAIAKAEGSL